jgi:hypothetical protein
MRSKKSASLNSKKSASLKKSNRSKKALRSLHAKAPAIAAAAITPAIAAAILGVVATVLLAGNSASFQVDVPAVAGPAPAVEIVELPAQTAPGSDIQVQKPIAALDAPAAVLASHSPAAGPTLVPAAFIEPAATVLPQEPQGVTIAGCLQHGDEGFRLKDTTGADAPKSRSWKSGFLKKRSATIGVVDAANRLQLPNHVGQRVSVTGTLEDKEMSARSLELLAESCD